MHPRMLAAREADAQTRIMAATAKLAEAFGIEPPVTVTQRLPDVAAMMRWEAVADWLEALAGAHAEREEQAAEAQAQAEAAQAEEDAKPKPKKGKANEQ